IFKAQKIERQTHLDICKLMCDFPAPPGIFPDLIHDLQVTVAGLIEPGAEWFIVPAEFGHNGAEQLGTHSVEETLVDVNDRQQISAQTALIPEQVDHSAAQG